MASLDGQTAVEPIDTDCYRSVVVPPIHMGDLADEAVAGNILAINAAYATVTAGQYLCSISICFVQPRQLIPEPHLPR
ncbi:hypothetical protein GB937_004966 [Aspergillus fischeri]|nr:hypothetical protein GB937_004966 [Aspergillus fischeri]